jgi:DtxR family Mn-dependent transcriptional regulator
VKRVEAMNNDYYRTVRGYQLANRQEGQLTSALEDYMEMTYRLCEENGYARIGQLSDILHVKPSSVSRMIMRLAELGLVKYDRYGIIQMTDSGRDLGEYLIHRHEVVEHLLTLIGCTNTLEETELIEHSLYPDTVHKLKTLLDFFKSHPDIKAEFDTFRKSYR